MDQISLIIATIAIIVFAGLGYGLKGHWRDVTIYEAMTSKLSTERDPKMSQQIIAYLQERLLTAPDEALSWYQLGVEHLRVNDLPSALIAFEQVLAVGGEQSPVKPLVQNLRARLASTRPAPEVVSDGMPEMTTPPESDTVSSRAANAE